MPAPKAFIDSNILLYLLSADADKANQAEEIVRAGGLISVQVLNEITNVARRKLAMSWVEINEVLALIRSICPTEPLTIETHDRGRLVAERYGLSVYDAMIVAAALLAGCKTLYSEDMQDGLLIDYQLHICNPFTSFINR
jgi:predicted nucleic acid-binding protein